MLGGSSVLVFGVVVQLPYLLAVSSSWGLVYSRPTFFLVVLDKTSYRFSYRFWLFLLLDEVFSLQIVWSLIISWIWFCLSLYYVLGGSNQASEL